MNIRGIPLIFRETQVGEIIHPHILVQWDTRVGYVSAYNFSLKKKPEFFDFVLLQLKNIP